MTPANADFATRITYLEGRVRKHDQDLYEGNGKPALTTRMQVQENFMNDVRKFLMWTAATSAATFLSVMGWMLVNLINTLHH